MSHTNTILNQLLKIIPRHESEFMFKPIFLIIFRAYGLNLKLHHLLLVLYMPRSRDREDLSVYYESFSLGTHDHCRDL